MLTMVDLGPSSQNQRLSIRYSVHGYSTQVKTNFLRINPAQSRTLLAVWLNAIVKKKMIQKCACMQLLHGYSVLRTAIIKISVNCFWSGTTLLQRTQPVMDTLGCCKYHECLCNGNIKATVKYFATTYWLQDENECGKNIQLFEW